MKATRSLVLLACCALIPLLNFPRALLADRSLFLRDINTVWSPQIESVTRQIANMEPPFFDARRGFGQPLFADPRAEVLYPPAWIHWILPPDRSYALFCALHLILGALGAARLAKRLTRGDSREGPLIAAFAYGAGGPMLSLVSHWHHLAAAAWMPWIVAECAPDLPGERIHTARLALLVSLQCLAGSPDYLALTLLLCALRLATHEGVTVRSSLDAGLGAALGFLLSAVQLLPSLAFARDAARDRLPIGLALSPLHPALTLETLAPVRVANWPLTPDAAGSLFHGMQVWMLSHYLGFTVWILALLGLKRMERHARRFAMGALLIGIVLSWGITAPDLQEWISRLPLVAGIRFPTKYLAGASLGLAMMAAAARGRDATFPAFPLRGTVVVGVMTLAGLSILWFWSTGGAFAEAAPFLVRAAVPIMVALAALLASRSLGATVLPLAVAIDLLGSQAGLNPTTPGRLFRDRPPLSALIPTGARVYVSDYSIKPAGAPIRPPAGIPYALARLPSGYSASEGVALAAAWYLAPPIAGRFGYHGSFDLDILDFYRAPLKRAITDFVTSRDEAHILDRLRRGSVEFVVTMDPPDLWRALPLVVEENRFFADTVRVYRVPGTWARTRFETRKGELEPEVGTLSVREMIDSRMIVDVVASRATCLVVAFANDHGWHATVDGVPARIEDNELAFIRVPVSPGSHQIELRYRPPFFGTGLVLSAAAFATLTIMTRRRTA